MNNRHFVAVNATSPGMGQNLARWLSKALKQSGMSQAEVARQLTERLRRQFDRAAVNKMALVRPKPGQKPRNIKGDELIALAEITGVPAPDAEPRAVVLKVVGYVGAGNEIYPIDDHMLGEGLEEIDLTYPQDVVPVIVRGDSMHPRYFDGEYVIYRHDGRSPQELIGEECVVKLTDGRMMVKGLRKGSKRGLFNLESWNAKMIEDVRVEWAAKVYGRASK